MNERTLGLQHEGLLRTNGQHGANSTFDSVHCSLESVFKDQKEVSQTRLVSLWRKIVVGGSSKNRGWEKGDERGVSLSPISLSLQPLPPEARPRAQPNGLQSQLIPGTVMALQPVGLQCHYGPRNKLAQCDSLSVMNCTGNQTVCFTLSGTWHGGKGSLQEVSCMAGLHAVCTNQC